MAVNEETQYSENMANIRHYSSLRFAILTVFVAITGALLSHISVEGCTVEATICHYSLTKIIGTWVSFAFLVFEIALNFYLNGFWSRIPTGTSWSRSGLLAWSVRIASISIPIGALVLWQCKL